MAASFNLTAQLNLVGPNNIRPIVRNIRSQLGGIKADVTFNISEQTITKVSKLNTELRKLNATLSQTNTASRQAAGGLLLIGQSINNIKFAGRIKDIENVGKATQQMGVRSRDAGKDMAVARTELEEFGRQSGLAVRRFAAFSLVTSIIGRLNSAISSAASEFVEFDKELVKVAQVTNKNLDQLGSLSETITNLSTEFGVSSKELLQVASTLAQAGLSANQTEAALKALALSAKAPSFDDLNSTTEGSIALMRQFGIASSDLEKALGSVNAVAAAFAVEASDLITAIQRTGGVFATASRGVSSGTDALNEFLAIFTSVRATTRESAETIATGLRTIFARIQRKDTIEALRQFGVELTDLEGKFVGPYEAIRRLSEGLSKLDPRSLEVAAITEELGGFRQIGKVIPLIQQFATTQEALAVAQAGSASLAKDAATAQLSLATRITKVREEFVALIRDIGNNSVFKSFLDITLSISQALLGIARSAKGIFPLLTILAAAKGVSAITQFVGGFREGIGKKQKDSTVSGSIGETIGSVLVGARSDKSSRDISNNSQEIVRLSSSINKLDTSVSNLTTVFDSLSSNLSTNTSALSDNTTRLETLSSAISELSLKIDSNKGGGPTAVSGGGRIYGFSKGGSVPGSGKGDKVPALLEPGEVVMSNRAVKQYGRGNLVRMNKYASGGYSVHFDYPEEGAIDDDAVNKGLADIASEATRNFTPKGGIRLISPKRMQTALGNNFNAIKGSIYETAVRQVGEGLSPTPGGDFDYEEWRPNKAFTNIKLKGTPTDAKISTNAASKQEFIKKIKNYQDRGPGHSKSRRIFGAIIFETGQTDKIPGHTISQEEIDSHNKAASGGKIQKFVEGGVAQRKVGYIDYDVIANEANKAIVEKGMEATGQKGPRLYTDYLTELAVKARKDSSLQKLRAIYGVAGSGKTTLARGQGTDDARLRKTERFPILSPADIQKATEILILSSSVSKDKLDEIFSKTDRTYTLSSTTQAEKERIKSQRASRDTTGIGLEGRKPGTTSGVGTDTAVSEALLQDKLGDRSVVLGRSESGKLRRKSGNELVEVIKKKIGFTWGGFAPMTAGHESIMDAASAMGIRPEDFIYLVGADEGITDPKAFRTAIFDQDARVLLAKAGAGARGATVLPKARDFEVPIGFDVSEETGRRKVILPGEGSRVFVADKTEKDLEKYKKTGYNVTNLERSGGISGTLVRDLIAKGNLAELQKVLSPGVYELISNNIGRIQNRANILPSIIEEVKKIEGIKLEEIDRQIQSIGISRINSKQLASDPEYAAKVEVLKELRAQRDKIKSAGSFEPYRLLAQLAAKEPEKYGLDFSIGAAPIAEPIRTVGTTQKASIGGMIQRFMAGGRPRAGKAYGPTRASSDQSGADLIAGIGGPINAAKLAKDKGFDLSVVKNLPATDFIGRVTKLAKQEPRFREALAEAINAKYLTDIGDMKSRGLIFGAVGMDGSEYTDKYRELSNGLKAPVTVGITGRVLNAKWRERIENRFDQGITSTVDDLSSLIGESENIRNTSTNTTPEDNTAKGIFLQKLIASFGATRGKSIDFPDGIGAAAAIFNDGSLFTDIPTDAKYTLSGPNDLIDNITNHLSSRGFRYGGIIQKFAAGGETAAQDSSADTSKIEAAKKQKDFGKIKLKSTGDGQISAAYIGGGGSGEVTASDIGGGLYSVGWSSATQGYGPRLYDVIMEGVTQSGKKLVSDRKRVSNSAKAVWEYYLKNRGDVNKTPITDRSKWYTGPQVDMSKFPSEDSSSWPPYNDISWALNTAYSKSPALINNKDIVQRFADGGSVPALVSNGEAYVPPDLAKKIGYNNLNKMNQADKNGMGRFSRGGISIFRGPGSGTSDSIPTNLPVGSFIIREKATKALGLSTGGSVGVSRRKFFVGGVAEKDAVRAQGVVLKNISEAEAEFSSLLTQLPDELRESILAGFKGIKEIKGNERIRIGSKETSTEGTRGIAAGSKAMAFQIQGKKAAATTETVTHETGHIADYKLGGDTGYASQQEGTFQFALIEKVKPQMVQAFEKAGESAERISQYLSSNAELFAEFFAKASPEVRNIITSTTDASKGMAALKAHLEEVGHTYAGLEASDIGSGPGGSFTEAETKAKNTTQESQQKDSGIFGKIAGFFGFGKKTPTPETNPALSSSTGSGSAPQLSPKISKTLLSLVDPGLMLSDAISELMKTLEQGNTTYDEAISALEKFTASTDQSTRIEAKELQNRLKADRDYITGITNIPSTEEMWPESVGPSRVEVLDQAKQQFMASRTPDPVSSTTTTPVSPPAAPSPTMPPEAMPKAGSTEKEAGGTAPVTRSKDDITKEIAITSKALAEEMKGIQNNLQGLDIAIQKQEAQTNALYAESANLDAVINKYAQTLDERAKQKGGKNSGKLDTKISNAMAEAQAKRDALDERTLASQGTLDTMKAKRSKIEDLQEQRQNLITEAKAAKTAEGPQRPKRKPPKIVEPPKIVSSWFGTDAGKDIDSVGQAMQTASELRTEQESRVSNLESKKANLTASKAKAEAGITPESPAMAAVLESKIKETQKQIDEANNSLKEMTEEEKAAKDTLLSRYDNLTKQVDEAAKVEKDAKAKMESAYNDVVERLSKAEDWEGLSDEQKAQRVDEEATASGAGDARIEWEQAQKKRQGLEAERGDISGGASSREDLEAKMDPAKIAEKARQEAETSARAAARTKAEKFTTRKTFETDKDYEARLSENTQKVLDGPKPKREKLFVSKQEKAYLEAKDKAATEKSKIESESAAQKTSVESDKLAIDATNLLTEAIINNTEVVGKGSETTENLKSALEQNRTSASANTEATTARIDAERQAKIEKVDSELEAATSKDQGPELEELGILSVLVSAADTFTGAVDGMTESAEMSGQSLGFFGSVMSKGGKFAASAAQGLASAIQKSENAFAKSKLGGVVDKISGLAGLIGTAAISGGIEKGAEYLGGDATAAGRFTKYSVGGAVSGAATAYGTAQSLGLGKGAATAAAIAAGVGSFVKGLATAAEAAREYARKLAEKDIEEFSGKATADAAAYEQTGSAADLKSAIDNLSQLGSAEQRARSGFEGEATDAAGNKTDEFISFAREQARQQSQGAGVATTLLTQAIKQGGGGAAGLQAVTAGKIEGLDTSQVNNLFLQIAQGNSAYQQTLLELNNTAEDEVDKRQKLQAQLEIDAQTAVAETLARQQAADAIAKETASREALMGQGFEYFKGLGLQTTDQQKQTEKALEIADIMGSGGTYTIDQSKAAKEAYSTASGTEAEKQKAAEQAYLNEMSGAFAQSESLNNLLLSINPEDKELQKEVNTQKANQLESLYKSRGMGDSPMLQKVLEALRADPAKTVAEKQLSVQEQQKKILEDIQKTGIPISFDAATGETREGVGANQKAAAWESTANFMGGGFGQALIFGGQVAYTAASIRSTKSKTPSAEAEDAQSAKKKVVADAGEAEAAKPRPKRSDLRRSKAPAAPPAPAPAPATDTINARRARLSKRGVAGAAIAGVGLVAGGYSYFTGSSNKNQQQEAAAASEELPENADVISLLSQIEENTRLCCGGGGGLGGGGGAFSIAPEDMLTQYLEQKLGSTDKGLKTKSPDTPETQQESGLMGALQHEFQSGTVNTGASLITDAIGVRSALGTAMPVESPKGMKARLKNMGLMGGANVGMQLAGAKMSYENAAREFSEGNYVYGANESLGVLAGGLNAAGSVTGGKTGLALGAVGDAASFVRNSSRLLSGQSFVDATIAQDIVSAGADATQTAVQTAILAPQATARVAEKLTGRAVGMSVAQGVNAAGRTVGLGVQAGRTTALVGGAKMAGGVAAGTVLSGAMNAAEFLYDPKAYDQKMRKASEERSSERFIGTINSVFGTDFDVATGKFGEYTDLLVGGLEGFVDPIGKFVEAGYTFRSAVKAYKEKKASSEKVEQEQQKNKESRVVGVSKETGEYIREQKSAQDFDYGLSIAETSQLKNISAIESEIASLEQQKKEFGTTDQSFVLNDRFKDTYGSATIDEAIAGLKADLGSAENNLVGLAQNAAVEEEQKRVRGTWVGWEDKGNIEKSKQKRLALLQQRREQLKTDLPAIQRLEAETTYSTTKSREEVAADAQKAEQNSQTQQRIEALSKNMGAVDPKSLMDMKANLAGMSTEDRDIAITQMEENQARMDTLLGDMDKSIADEFRGKISSMSLDEQNEILSNAEAEKAQLESRVAVGGGAYSVVDDGTGGGAYSVVDNGAEGGGVSGVDLLSIIAEYTVKNSAILEQMLIALVDSDSLGSVSSKNINTELGEGLSQKDLNEKQANETESLLQSRGMGDNSMLRKASENLGPDPVQSLKDAMLAQSDLGRYQMGSEAAIKENISSMLTKDQIQKPDASNPLSEANRFVRQSMLGQTKSTAPVTQSKFDPRFSSGGAIPGVNVAEAKTDMVSTSSMTPMTDATAGKDKALLEAKAALMQIPTIPANEAPSTDSAPSLSPMGDTLSAMLTASAADIMQNDMVDMLKDITPPISAAPNLLTSAKEIASLEAPVETLISPSDIMPVDDAPSAISIASLDDAIQNDITGMLKGITPPISAAPNLLTSAKEIASLEAPVETLISSSDIMPGSKAFLANLPGLDSLDQGRANTILQEQRDQKIAMQREATLPSPSDIMPGSKAFLANLPGLDSLDQGRANTILQEQRDQKIAMQREATLPSPSDIISGAPETDPEILADQKAVAAEIQALKAEAEQDSAEQSKFSAEVDATIANISKGLQSLGIPELESSGAPEAAPDPSAMLTASATDIMQNDMMDMLNGITPPMSVAPNLLTSAKEIASLGALAASPGPFQEAAISAKGGIPGAVGTSGAVGVPADQQRSVVPPPIDMAAIKQQTAEKLSAESNTYGLTSSEQLLAQAEIGIEDELNQTDDPAKQKELMERLRGIKKQTASREKDIGLYKTAFRQEQQAQQEAATAASSPDGTSAISMASTDSSIQSINDQKQITELASGLQTGQIQPQTATQITAQLCQIAAQSVSLQGAISGTQNPNQTTATPGQTPGTPKETPSEATVAAKPVVSEPISGTATAGGLPNIMNYTPGGMLMNSLGISPPNLMNYSVPGMLVNSVTGGGQSAPQQPTNTGSGGVLSNVSRPSTGSMISGAGAVVNGVANFAGFDITKIGESLQGVFGSFIENLKNINLPKIPDKIMMEGKHTVEVIINGAEILKSLDPTIRDLIDNKIAEFKNKINKDTEGGFGP
jgi:hypothetical protein